VISQSVGEQFACHRGAGANCCLFNRSAEKSVIADQIRVCDLAHSAWVAQPRPCSVTCDSWKPKISRKKKLTLNSEVEE